MIASLRARHRAIFATLAVALPGALALALVSRREAPIAAAIARAVTGPSEPVGPPTRGGVSRHGTVEVHWREWLAERVLELSAPRDLALPDLLVYWSEARPDTKLPTPCTLLGPFAGTAPRRFALPEATRGWVSLYSLAHQEVVWTWELLP